VTEAPLDAPSTDPSDDADAAARTAKEAAGEAGAAMDLAEARLVQIAVTNHNAPVHAGSYNAGFATPVVGRRRTGPLSPREVDEALDGYTKPGCFQTALGLLERKRLLVLTGPEGAGKRAGALALLRELGSTEIVGISPVVSLGDLALYNYREGKGYLVQDRLAETGQSAQLAFDLGAVVRALGRDAFMVVTATPESVSGAWLDFAVQWDYPDPAHLLDQCLEGNEVAVDEQGRDRLLALAREHPLPAQVVEMVRQVREHGGDVEVALESTVAAVRARLATWFDSQPAPTQRQVLFLATLCFANGLPERLFDGVLGLLEERFTEAAARAGPAPPAPRPEPGAPAAAGLGEDHDPPIRQTRGNVLVGCPIEVVREARPVPGVALPERRVLFKVSMSRGLVMEVLWDRYGRELWDPLTDWVRELARFGVAEVRQQIAFGVVQLGGLAGQGTLMSFLEPWARGYRRERLTAAYALWWSCLNDTFAPLALKTALSWSKQSSPAYRLTAVTALSGQLGILYPGEALQALWRVLHRGDDVSVAACRAFPELFCALTVTGGNGGVVLRFLRSYGEELTGPRYELHALRRLLATVRWVLAAKVASTGELIAVTTLQTGANQDDQLATTGWLWAELLCFRPLRGDAIDLLEQTLRALSQGPDGDRLIRQLGDAIAAPLPPRELALLRRDLEAAFAPAAGDGAGTDYTRAFVSALLDAVEQADGAPRPQPATARHDA
jgi:hypothetical protein